MPFVSTPNLRLHYREAGEGERVTVLLHGSAACGRIWELLLPLLPPGVRAVVPDLRGFGASDKPEADYTISQAAADLRHLMWELDLARFVLVGHDLGAAVALDFALRWPHRVEGLVLMGSPPASGHQLPPEAFPLLAATARDRRQVSLQLAAVTPGAARDYFWDQLVDDALAAADAVAPYARSLAAWNVAPYVGNLPMPVLFLHGSEDPLVNPEQIQATLAAFSDARLQALANCGHAPMVEQPASVAAALSDFLATLRYS